MQTLYKLLALQTNAQVELPDWPVALAAAGGAAPGVPVLQSTTLDDGAPYTYAATGTASAAEYWSRQYGDRVAPALAVLYPDEDQHVALEDGGGSGASGFESPAAAYRRLHRP